MRSRKRRKYQRLSLAIPIVVASERYFKELDVAIQPPARHVTVGTSDYDAKGRLRIIVRKRYWRKFNPAWKGKLLIHELLHPFLKHRLLACDNKTYRRQEREIRTLMPSTPLTALVRGRRVTLSRVLRR